MRQVFHCMLKLSKRLIFIYFTIESDSGSSESDSESSHSESQKEPEEAVVVLTEDEMNKLGAKIMKAELMGNQVVNRNCNFQITSKSAICK